MQTLAKGFTLIEVLVALTIFAVVAVSTSLAASNYANTVGHLEKQTFAYFALKNRMAEIAIKQEVQNSNLIPVQQVKFYDETWSVNAKSIETSDKLLKKVYVSVSDNSSSTNKGDQPKNNILAEQEMLILIPNTSKTPEYTFQ